MLTPHRVLPVGAATHTPAPAAASTGPASAARADSPPTPGPRALPTTGPAALSTVGASALPTVRPSAQPTVGASALPSVGVSAQSTTGPQATVTAPRPPDGTTVARRPAADETAIVQTTARALVADDGTRILLDRHYVFGRDPFHEPSVLRGAASPIVVRDPDQLISRVQAYIAVVAGAVTVRDGGSANGTYIAAPGAKEWTRLGEQPSVLPPGWSMRIGRRVYTYVEAGSLVG